MNGKTTRAVLVGVAALVGLWIVAHVPAYLDYLKECGDCGAQEAHCIAARGLAPQQIAQQICSEARRRCEACRAEAWKVFFPG